MTIQEASAVNVLLTHMLGTARYERTPYPSLDEVKQATELLADKAYRALYAGWSAEEVAEVWEAKKKVRIRRDV